MTEKKSKKFERAFSYVLQNEGVYVNDLDDIGGETKYGISKRSYPNLDIKNLTLEEAQKIYFCNYWLMGKFEQSSDENIAIQLLLPQNLKDQYAFKTEKALSMLEFSEVKFI